MLKLEEYSQVFGVLLGSFKVLALRAFFRRDGVARCLDKTFFCAFFCRGSVALGMRSARSDSGVLYVKIYSLNIFLFFNMGYVRFRFDSVAVDQDMQSVAETSWQLNHRWLFAVKDDEGVWT